MIRIEVNIDDDQLMDSLAALARQGEDASPIMRGLAGIMRSAAQCPAHDRTALPNSFRCPCRYPPRSASRYRS